MSDTSPRYDPSTDPIFSHPVIEVDEWRERFLPDGTRLPFRYMRGGFAGTGVRFDMLFPEKESYAKRFHQCVTPGAEAADPGPAIALRSGAYYVASSSGTTEPWKASAAAAELSRRKAREIYGPDRSYGYVYGGEEALTCVENASAWDGAALLLPGPRVILYDAGQTIACARQALPDTLTALAAWVEKGVRPTG